MRIVLIRVQIYIIFSFLAAICNHRLKDVRILSRFMGNSYLILSFLFFAILLCPIKSF